uniref:Pim proto-oncogene, serine/threonine kinase, related 193 n=1 Tax=Danio rerio TaxID=7955 RepID=UPI003D9CB915
MNTESSFMTICDSQRFIHSTSTLPNSTSMENNSAEKQPESRKNIFPALFRNIFLTVKGRRRGNVVSTPQPTSDMDLYDPQPGPSGLQYTAVQDHTDTQSGPSSLNPTTSDTNTAYPEAEEKQTKSKMNKISAFFKRRWRAVKRASTSHKKNNKMAPQLDNNISIFEPLTLRDPLEDLQSGLSIPDRDPDVPEKTLLEECDLLLKGLQNLNDPPAPSTFPGPALKKRYIGNPTWLRTVSNPGPCTLPLSELYEVEEEIGKGFFGRVCKGIRKSDGKQVAIKFTAKRETDRYITIPGVAEPLFVEVALNLLLNQPPLSPYIVHMLDWFEEPDQFILILEYSQPSKELFKFFVKEKPSESQARSLMYQAVLGAKHCLDRGVLHRDIKLDNYVINTETNQVKLIDFGCGDIVKDDYNGQFIGFACPPEYFVDLKYDAESLTVWSLGIMMYGMVCKYPASTAEVHNLTFDAQVSAEFQDLIKRCLAYEPSERATMEEVLQHEWFQQEQIPGPTPKTVPLSELYEVEEEIGKGFFGRVCKGIRKSDGKQVAIKFIMKRETDRYIIVPGVSKPLFVEVALNLQLNQPPLSPYIVHMLDWFEEPDQFILVMEYSQPSKELFKFFVKEKPSESQARSLMYQAVLGAKHCLDQGVLHRDIKLDNYVINTETNQVKLIDFGCGDIVKDDYNGQFIGFACPPEFFVDLKYDAESLTVWSLGIMMYGMVCKYPATTAEVHNLTFHSKVSAEFQDLIKRCLAYEPSERATMEEVLQHKWFQQEQKSRVPLESEEE